MATSQESPLHPELRWFTAGDWNPLGMQHGMLWVPWQREVSAICTQPFGILSWWALYSSWSPGTQHGPLGWVLSHKVVAVSG